MISVYSASNVTDAHIVLDLLKRAGIPATIRGEYLQGGGGELPVAGLIDVCVDESRMQDANEVLSAWQRGDYALPEETTDHTPAPSPRRSIWPAVCTAFVVGGMLGAGALWTLVATPRTQDGVDYNDDGTVDERIYWSGNRVSRIEIDRNLDGRVDSITHYDLRDMPSRTESDEDFDGRMEANARYFRGQWSAVETDYDGDGAIDYRADGNAGVVQREQWLDAGGTVIKEVLYRGSQPITSAVDSDGDGQLDAPRKVDRIGEIAGGSR